ncbi:FIST C-terminal domain-containing protein [Sulfurimonas sp. SAG-AH-194-C20]|nr:FIST N-terminal domain-containing protein [Sulfurimonas sp. SAG-AH-194-C20]MDF1878707.1 FIST C-terminal domain-containing protein [Sulfurimonas sp. SAG-AH-194-C20]
MQVNTHIYKEEKWDSCFDENLDSPSTLVLILSSLDTKIVQKEVLYISEMFAKSIIIGSSTSGEIYKNEVYEDSIVVSVIKFNSTVLKKHICKSINSTNSYEDGVDIANELLSADLKGVFVLSDGLKVNGSRLTKGMASVLKSSVVVSGGLAGDKDKFESTWIIEDGLLCDSSVLGVGFYGNSINFEAASKGGWDRLGLFRTVTKSKDNVLYEMDGKPALEIYKRYLGEKAKELPSSALLFPLEIKDSIDASESKVRTILGVNNEENSITFAGDIPEGSHVTLMKANFERLIDGAGQSADSLSLNGYRGEEILCIAISCVGRKLVLKSRIDEEVEAIEEVLPSKVEIIGFYSYGEISPLSSGVCDLHNQTMTLTAIWESNA